MQITIQQVFPLHGSYIFQGHLKLEITIKLFSTHWISQSYKCFRLKNSSGMVKSHLLQFGDHVSCSWVSGFTNTLLHATHTRTLKIASFYTHIRHKPTFYTSINSPIFYIFFFKKKTLCCINWGKKTKHHWFRVTKCKEKKNLNILPSERDIWYVGNIQLFDRQISSNSYPINN